MNNKCKITVKSIASILSLAFSSQSYAEHAELPSINVTGTQSEFSSSVIQPDFINAPQGDIAKLLPYVPGANVNSNGALTGIAQYRGMYGDRVNIMIDGIKISSGGPNAMDPALSYIPKSRLQSLEVIRGIAPVRSGNETIGGSMMTRSIHSEFGDDDNVEFHGQVAVGGQTADTSYDVSTLLSITNQNHRFQLAASREEGDDTRFDGGDIHPSEHERNVYDLGYGYQQDDHEIAVNYERRDSNATGTPALPMDIVFVNADIASAKYKGVWNKAEINSKVYYTQVDHKMSNFELRDAPTMTMMNGMTMPMRRFALTDSEDYGYGFDAAVSFAGGTLKLGTDGHFAEHNADIFNPMDSRFLVKNFHEVERDVFGFYGEWDKSISNIWDLQLGMRYTRIEMDAGEVSAGGFPMAMLQMQANTLATNFNASAREQTDNNIDLVVKLTKHINNSTDLEVGIARKTRSPSYQERYLWLPLESTAGLADGNNYVGNVDLKPEVAYQFELGIDQHTDQYYLSPRAFYHHVDDYIQGVDHTSGGASRMFHNMLTGMLGSNSKLLQFANVDARLYGIDLNWGVFINPQWRLNGVLSYVEGKRRDTEDYLYRISPITTTLGLTHQRNDWSATLETVAASAKSHVSSVTNEQKTGGYALLNLYAQYQSHHSGFSLTAGIDNLLDKTYTSHLSGYNRVSNSDVDKGQRVPGAGISAYVSINYEW